jgi:Domain of unknown function (DUF222)/HNH endonuclease
MSVDHAGFPPPAMDTSRLSRDELIAALKASEHRTRLEEAHKMALVAEAVNRNLAADTEYRNLVELLRDTLHITRDESKTRIACARAVRPTVAPSGAEIAAPLATTRAALERGLTGLEQVKVIATLHEELPDTVHPDDWTAIEQTLGDLAAQADARVVARAARRARECLDPDGAEPHDPRETGERTLDYTRLRTGAGRGTFRLDPESLAMLDMLNSVLAKPHPATDGVRDTRTLAERQGDALRDILRLALNAADLPTEAGERPHFVITMRLENLQRDLRGALLHDGRELTPAEVRRHACDANLIPAVLGTHSEPLDLGRGHRLVTIHLRRALVLRDRGCAFPNCARPARWCDAHHIHHWLDGGKTSLDNCVLLCSMHQQLMHKTNCEWDIHLVDGHPVFRPPTYIDPERTPLRNTLHHKIE